MRKLIFVWLLAIQALVAQEFNFTCTDEGFFMSKYSDVFTDGDWTNTENYEKAFWRDFNQALPNGYEFGPIYVTHLEKNILCRIFEHEGTVSFWDKHKGEAQSTFNDSKYTIKLYGDGWSLMTIPARFRHFYHEMGHDVLRKSHSCDWRDIMKGNTGFEPCVEYDESLSPADKANWNNALYRMFNNEQYDNPYPYVDSNTTCQHGGDVIIL